MEVTINLPEDVAQVFLKNGENIERKVLEATAIEGYREGKLSQAQVSRMLDLNRFETDEFLKRTTFRLIIRSKIWSKTVKRLINFFPNDCRFRHFAA